ncbi:SufD family Fe-S cluster assembly protein [uncultured Desulfosarcina sp.]|uniref:SufB/SufD family protein n=1 Tax=uncultured Desulfosarcina sp. TaxID=218289 RepID=UPI0029C714AE|nr:SufD family Fe-S cluster assembly protein [uncultured Desulfosarcina sp.]
MPELEKNASLEVDLRDYTFDGANAPDLPDLSQVSEADRQQLRMAGVDIDEADRSGTFLQFDQSRVHCRTKNPDVEILGIEAALEKYQGLPEYYWKALDPDKDDFTRQTAKEIHGGYFIRTKKGATIQHPVQSCLYIKGKDVAQAVHNVVVVEEDSEVHIITGCATAHGVQSALHLGISEFYVKKNGRLTFTMVHNWGEQVAVRPRTAVHVEENGVFVSNYILLKPVRTVQSYPAVYLNGPGGLARFNSVIVAPEGSHVDTGNKIVLNAPNTRGEIISKTITTGGTIIARGFIGGHAVPARGHLECKGLILGKGVIHAIPELVGSVPGVELSHEAAVGKIAREEIEYLMARGLDEEEATSTIVRGFLNVDIMGLPQELKESIEKTIRDSEKDMF